MGKRGEKGPGKGKFHGWNGGVEEKGIPSKLKKVEIMGGALLGGWFEKKEKKGVTEKCGKKQTFWRKPRGDVQGRKDVKRKSRKDGTF